MSSIQVIIVALIIYLLSDSRVLFPSAGFRLRGRCAA
jgi:hypothetical protein